MAAINTLLKEINSKVVAENFDDAMALYSDLLKDDHKEWKCRVIKHVIKLADDTDFDYFYSHNVASLFVLDDRFDHLILVWITNPGIAQKDYDEMYKWMESTRMSIAEEIVDEYGYPVSVLHIVNSQDTEALKAYQDDENTHFFHAIPRTVEFAEYVPLDMIENPPDDNDYDGFYDCCQMMASGLSDLEAPDIDEGLPTEKSRDKAIAYGFDILDTAPAKLHEFLNDTKKALQGKPLNEIFSLSLHAAFVGDFIAKPDELSERFRDVLIPDDEVVPPISVVTQDICEVDDIKAFDSFFEGQENSLIIIKNIETKIKPLFTFNKTDIIRILCKHLDTTQKNIFIIMASDNGWNELVSEFPLIRVFFQNIFHFEALSVENLQNHLKSELKKHNLAIEPEALKLSEEFFGFFKSSNKPEQYNLTLSTMLARESRYYQAIRLSQNPQDEPSTITRADIEKAVQDEYMLEPKNSLKEVMSQLDRLIGLENVKDKVKDLAALVKVNRLRQQGDKQYGTPVSLNAVFTGNPGTGKTTVAHMMGDVYKSIGALSSGHVISISRQDIVAQWIGHTEENMKQFIKKAHGGVLFIDEAYSLYQKDSERDFGLEAINVLVDSLEQIKDHTCVILAGYTEPMRNFMNGNPGLISRFPNIIEFEDYNANQLHQISMLFIQNEHFYMDKAAEDLLKEIVMDLEKNKGKDFGNARMCRNLFENLKLIQARRITYADDHSKTDLNQFLLEDIRQLQKDFKADKINKGSQRRTIGYKAESGR